MKSKLHVGFAFLFFCAISPPCFAQLNINAQLRIRSELRDGQGSPLPHGARPAFFTSQRTRLNLSYGIPRLKIKLAVQDVRVWGQDVSTINRSTTADNNGILLHEAWAEVSLLDSSAKTSSLSLRIGRQELVYDDQRLIGNLDWLQQGRRHDAALLRFEANKWSVHAGAAFNQNKENSSGTIYNSNPPGNYPASSNGGTMYKSMQFLYGAHKFGSSYISLLFFADQFSKYSTDTINNVPVKTFESGSWTRATTGVCYNRSTDRIAATGSLYYQFGKTATSQEISAFLANASVQYAINTRLRFTGGFDYTSGGQRGNTSKTFDPLYGTPHKFWGGMDYYYAANGFGKRGLTDYYFKSSYTANKRLVLNADFHHFNSAAAASNNSSSKRNLGQEIDFITNYTITKEINIEAGYSHYFSTRLLTSPEFKNVPDARSNANWAYVMINIRPTLFAK